VRPAGLVVPLVVALPLSLALLWPGLSVRRPPPPRPAAPRALRWMAIGCCCLVAITIVAGGFVAGTHAGRDYNTFPLMGGHLLPEGYANLAPWLRNLT